jgi:hypothetical protein
MTNRVLSVTIRCQITSVVIHSSPNYCVSAHIAGYGNLRKIVNVSCFLWTLKMFLGGWPLPHLVWTTGIVPPSKAQHCAERRLVLWEPLYIEGGCKKSGSERSNALLSSLSSGTACFSSHSNVSIQWAKNATSVYKSGPPAAIREVKNFKSADVESDQRDSSSLESIILRYFSCSVLQ